MANKIILKKSSVPGKTPQSSDLDFGELALNYADGELYYKTSTGVVDSLNSFPGSANQIIYKNASNEATGSTGLQYDGVSLKVNGNLESVYSNGDEGGEIYLNKPQTNTSLAAGVTIDVYQNKLRIFENGGTNRGVYIDLTTALNGVGTNLIGGGTAGVTSVGGYSGEVTATQLLTAIKTVDGSGSGLDADLLDGQTGSYYLDWTNVTNKPDPVITLAGDLTGSVTLTDLASGTLTATIAANSVALGTDTTGNYAADITQGSGIVVGGLVGEGTQYTVSHADTSSVLDLTSDNAGNTFIQDINFTFDGFGHVTGASVATGTVSVGDGALTLATSGVGLSGSASFTANQSGAATFTVTSNATSSNTASTIVARDASGNFTAGTITASLSGNASTVTNGVYTSGSYADPAWITSLAKSKVGLGNVENTALSTWAGSTNITTIGAATASSLIVTGDLTVNGTVTTINSTTVSVDDKNIELGAVTTPSNATADGGGITLKGTTDKTFNWMSATDAWTSSEHLALASGKDLILNGAVSGSVTLVVPDAAGTTTITLPATTGTVITTGDTGTVTSTMLAGSIANSKLTNSSITVNGTAISLGGSGTITATATNALTIGSYLTGISYNGSSAVTIAVDATSANTSNKVVARDASGNFSAGTITAALSGNASTASSAAVLTTARTINGVSFDGSTNITVTATATNALTIGTGLSGTSYNGSSAVTITNTGVLSVNGSAGAITGIATTGSTLAQFAATTSAQLAGIISDETGSGALVFATSPTLTTPNIGAATGTSLTLSGALQAATKSFLIPHPTKEGKKLRYGSLESPYHGVRLTGEATLIGKTCRVDLPDYIHGLCKQEGAQVQLTNIKHGKVLWVEIVNIDEDYFDVSCDRGLFDNKEYKFYWSFTAIRKDIEDIVVEIDNE